MEEFVGELSLKIKADDETDARQQIDNISTKLSEANPDLSEIESSVMPKDEYEQKKGQSV